MDKQADKRNYAVVDIDFDGSDAVEIAFGNQVAYCSRANAPITARVADAVLHVVLSEARNTLLDKIRGWQGAPLADALPLRIVGGIHALHLSGKAPELAPIYRGDAVDDAQIIKSVMLGQEEALLPWLDSPPQTNEAGRSSNFIAAMAWMAAKGLPPRFDCLEIGSSAGINLMMDRYGYDLGGVKIGPESPVMQFAPEWKGAPPPDEAIEISSLRGCDVAPVDLTDPAQALRLKAYFWPEHSVRFARMDAAIGAANERKPDLVPMNAADFVEAELAKPQQSGTTRMLMHSIVWQYVPKDQQQRVTRAMEDVGAKATPDKPIAWVQVEADRVIHRHKLVVKYWPGANEETQLAWSHPHGADIEWLAG